LIALALSYYFDHDSFYINKSQVRLLIKNTQLEKGLEPVLEMPAVYKKALALSFQCLQGIYFEAKSLWKSSIVF
jgi:hypothetical protein